MNDYRFSIHRVNSTAKTCDIGGCEIPVRHGKITEYWRVKGGQLGVKVPRTICVMCHELLGFPSDGWESSADGRDMFTALTPQRRAPDVSTEGR